MKWSLLLVLMALVLGGSCYCRAPETASVENRASLPQANDDSTTLRYRQMKRALPEIVRRVKALEEDFPVLNGIASTTMPWPQVNGYVNNIVVRNGLQFSRNVENSPKAMAPMPIDESQPYCQLTIEFWESVPKCDRAVVANRSTPEGSPFGLDVQIFTSDSKLKKTIRGIIEEEMVKAGERAQAPKPHFSPTKEQNRD